MSRKKQNGSLETVSYLVISKAQVTRLSDSLNEKNVNYRCYHPFPSK